MNTLRLSELLREQDRQYKTDRADRPVTVKLIASSGLITYKNT